MADLPPYSSLTSRASIGSLRGAPHPPSPRSSSRHPSLSQQSMADILSAPPHPRQEGGATLRDWRSVKVGELLSQKQLRFVDLETPVESACQVWDISSIWASEIIPYLYRGVGCGEQREYGVLISSHDFCRLIYLREAFIHLHAGILLSVCFLRLLTWAS